MIRPVRLLVLSPDRRRVLARPNGLSGWTLPTIAVEGSGWDDAAAAAAAAVVGVALEPVGEPAGSVWLARAIGRIPMNGSEWIGRTDAARLGRDAHAARVALDGAATDGSERPGTG